MIKGENGHLRSQLPQRLHGINEVQKKGCALRYDGQWGEGVIMSEMEAEAR